MSNPLKNSAIIILGASGDLTRQKLIPALGRLFDLGKIDDSCAIVGSGRTEFSQEEFKDKFDQSKDFKEILHYYRGIEGLKNYLSSLGNFDRFIFFLALPPKVYAQTAKNLYYEGFGCNSCRLIIEKPFGYDYESAKNLNNELKKYFYDENIFRIDHYLAKEPVQNILVFRFANYIFNELMSNKYIDSIQINAFEDVGIKERGAYFDKSGIIRDMVQNHLTQLLTLLTMEAPVSLEPEEIRKQKIDILKKLKLEDYRRFQYLGYRKENGVDPESETETYAELKLHINNFRWFDVPVNIRAGKALNRKGTEIGIVFKQLPDILYKGKNSNIGNKIIFKIQPSEGIVIDIATKKPGTELKIENSNMAFCYKTSFDEEIPEAYERLLLDALKGDRTLFVGAEESELSWKVFNEIWKTKSTLGFYEKGQPPQPLLCDNWINFENYIGSCPL